MVSVLIADDSLTVRRYLSELIEADPRLTVCGHAVDGLDAVAKIGQLKPDVVIMDIEMPRLDGIAATRRIMRENPVPIVICSANLSVNLTEKSYQAIAAGALAAVAKPKGPGAPGAQEMAARLLHKVRLMAAVKVVRRRGDEPWEAVAGAAPGPEAAPGLPAAAGRGGETLPADWPFPRLPALVAIGASTGGPMALLALLQKLPENFPVPILVVQHIAENFLEGMISWLQGQVSLGLGMAVHGECPLPGRVYFAPDGFHLEITPDFRVRLTRAAPEHSVRPAVSCLFRSLARPEAPPAVGILLTGMGRDGAAELLAMRGRELLTIAQDEASAVVDGMPGEAARLGAARVRLNPGAIADLLSRLHYAGAANAGTIPQPK